MELKNEDNTVGTELEEGRSWLEAEVLETDY